ncbi:hypothetical protein PsorP6_014418 [Peronosclerospora sorghi]|uniref:Uncharacterized protein n=1 Tax=Peronosclerospora sorghi TaxID=230839 RepID=A0ACC0VHS7_9STRA|nr:hypothetical protein PsorP6_014418 [Peronosclerospora sorghi]
MFSNQALLVLVQPLYTHRLERDESECSQATDLDTNDPDRPRRSPISYPILGVRRKWYVVLGSIHHAVAVFTLAGIRALHPLALPPRDALVVFALYLVSVVSFGCMITTLCIQMRVMEYSQLESLRDRGTLQVSYLVFRCVVSIGTSVLSFLAVCTGATSPLSIFSCMNLLEDVKSSSYYPSGVSFYPVTTFNTLSLVFLKEALNAAFCTS